MNKIDKSLERLKLASEMSLTYYCISLVDGGRSAVGTNGV